MYQPPHHREDRLEVQHALIRSHPLGTLVTVGASGLVANALPFIIDATRGQFGTLQAHLARANNQWRDFDAKVDALVIFQGVESYITPSWYPTKQDGGKVVPTWNYAIVQVSGPLQVIEDRDWLKTQIGALTALQEGRREEPWAVSDAPTSYVESQLKGIVGIEIPIARIEGKWKVSQNRPEADRRGVVEGLRGEGDEASDAMAALVEKHSPPSRG
jgi:transcriptional regulator